MTSAGYIAAGYVTVFGSVLAYAVRVLTKGRKLSQQVPESERRWT